MAEPKPYILSDVSFEIEDKSGTKHQFSCWLTGYSITSAEATTQDVTVLCPPTGTVSLAGVPGAWTLALDYVADWCNLDSFSWFLVNNEGATGLSWTLVDRAGCDTGVNIQGVASSLPTAGFGGTSGSPSTFTGAAIKLTGKPTVAAAAAAALATTVVTSASGGSFGPVGSKTPADLAELKASPTIGDGGSAAPATDTPTGEYVTLGDQTKAHYKTNVWAAGVAA